MLRNYRNYTDNVQKIISQHRFAAVKSDIVFLFLAQGSNDLADIGLR